MLNELKFFSKENKHKLYIFILAIILIIHTLILTKLQFFPYPELFVYPYLTNHGLKPYSQILDQHFPGLMFLPVNFDNLGMNNEITARYWLIAVVLITHLLLFLISKELFKDYKKALFVNFLYLLWQPFFEGWVLWLDNFMPLFFLPAFYFLWKNKFFSAGLFIGLSIVFKQVAIPLGGLVFLYILWEKRKLKLLKNYLIGVLIPVILMLMYLIYLGVFKDFIYWTILFNLTVYAQFGTQTPQSLGFVTRVGLVYATSLISLFDKNRKRAILLFVFIIGSVTSILDRADFVHFQPSLPFILIATVIGIFSIKKRNVQLGLILVYFLIAIWWQNIFYIGHLSNKVFFFDQQTKTVSEKIKILTKKEEKIFVFGAAPNLYQMSDRLPAGDIFVFPLPWFLKVSEGRILEGIKKDKPKIIVADRNVEIEMWKLTDFARKLDKYIFDNYKIIDKVGSVDILERIND